MFELLFGHKISKKLFLLSVIFVLFASCTNITVAPNTATSPGYLRLVPAGTVTGSQTRGYAEYVPENYLDSGNWPCIIALHGDGELGDGLSEEALRPFTYFCITGMIQNDTWDSQDRFVVLAPQFSSYADRSAVNVHDFIQYAKEFYNINESKIYLTAVSGGGVALGNYLTNYSGGEARAILPVSCYLPPISQAEKWKHVPAWFFCGLDDVIVKPANLISIYKNIMNSSNPPVIAPRITLYTHVGHDGNSANKTYAPDLMDNTFETEYDGVALFPYTNIYDWLLQY